jgi:hypothetical protein
MMVFGEKLSNEFNSTTSPAVGVFNSGSDGNNQLYPLTSSNSDAKNALRFVNTMRNVVTGSGVTSSAADDHDPLGKSLTIFGEKEVTNIIYACRISNTSFNHTNNFTILSGSARNRFTDDVGRKDGFIIGPLEGGAGSYVGEDGVTYTTGSSTMDGDPHTFITQVHLYDNFGTMVATAALSKPFMKSFDREAVIKVKLTF